MAPIYKGDTEVLDGQLKIGNQDVKEVYLGSEKIWPSKIIYPDPVDRFFWKVGAGTDAYAIGLLGSTSHGFTQRPSVPSGTPPNLDTGRSQTSTSISGDRYCQFLQNVYRVDSSSRYRWQNGKAKFTFDMKKWNLVDTDFNCYLKLVGENLRFSPEHLWDGRVYSNVFFEGHRIVQCESSYVSPGPSTNILSWTGTSGFDERTWVSEKTVGEYFEENDGLVDVNVSWAVRKDDSNNTGGSYGFADRENSSYIRFSFDEISFTTTKPDLEKPEFHRCSNLRHVGNMESDKPVFRDNYRITIGSVNNTVRIWEFRTSPPEYPVKAPNVGFGHKEGNRDETNRFYFWGCTSGTDANQLAAQLNNDDLNELHVNGVSLDISGVPLRGAWKAFQGSVLGGGVAWGVYVDIPNTLSAVWDAKYQGANFVGLTR